MMRTVGVMGPSAKLTPVQYSDATAIGALVASRQYALLTGGLSGVMEAASKGAKEAGGLVIGICPVGEKAFVNPYVDIAVMTNMGGGRNYMNILSSGVVVAIGCNKSAGTLSEISFALQMNKPLMVVKPPPKMQEFLESFQAPGSARFGETIEDVEHFLTEAFEELDELERMSRRKRRLF